MLRKWLFVLLFGLFVGGLGTSAAAAVNLNTASETELQAVKGIGPAKAKAIVDYRTKNGSFKKVEDLQNVSGFGAKSVEKLKPELTVGGGASGMPKPATSPSAASGK